MDWYCNCGQVFKSRRKLQAHHKECSLFLSHKGHNQFTKARELGLPKPEVSIETREKLRKVASSRKHTEEEKKKISESMKKVYQGRSIWATQIENRKSYAEQYFDDLFPTLKHNYNVDRYFLDLADPIKKLYIEVDGEQHYNDSKVIEHDKIRTERLSELGWVCVKRIRWSTYKKLSHEEKETIINEIKITFNL